MKTTNSDKTHKKRAGKLLKLILFLSLGLFFILFFWFQLDPVEQQKIILNFRNANYFWLVLSIVPGLVSHWLRAARWNMLISTFVKKPSLNLVFHSVMSGYLANLAFPRLGEITRCAMLNRKTQIPFDKLLGSVVAERAFDLLTYVIILVAAIAIYFQKLSGYIHDKVTAPLQNAILNANYLSWLMIFAGLIILILVIRFLLRRFKNNKLLLSFRNILSNVSSGLVSIFRIRKLWLFITYTILMWVGYWAMVYISFFALDATSMLPPGSALVIMAFGTIGIILVQGGIGIYPIIVSELLIYYSIDISDGYALGWLTWSAQTFLVLILGLLAFIVFPMLKNKSDEVI